MLPPLCVLPDLCELGFFFPLSIQSLSFFGFCAHEDKRMTKEETENAEIFL